MSGPPRTRPPPTMTWTDLRTRNSSVASSGSTCRGWGIYGRLFLREGHPVLWALADARPDHLLALEFPYFQRDEPTVWDEAGSYVATDTAFTHTRTHTWSHGLGEVFTALFDAGMQVTALVEHDSVPWEALPGQMEHLPGGEWRVADRPWRLPHTYTLQAIKRR